MVKAKRFFADYWETCQNNLGLKFLFDKLKIKNEISLKIFKFLTWIFLLLFLVIKNTYQFQVTKVTKVTKIYKLQKLLMDDLLVWN